MSPPEPEFTTKFKLAPEVVQNNLDMLANCPGPTLFLNEVTQLWKPFAPLGSKIAGAIDRMFIDRPKDVAVEHYAALTNWIGDLTSEADEQLFEGYLQAYRMFYALWPPKNLCAGRITLATNIHLAMLGIAPLKAKQHGGLGAHLEAKLATLQGNMGMSLSPGMKTKWRLGYLNQFAVLALRADAVQYLTTIDSDFRQWLKEFAPENDVVYTGIKTEWNSYAKFGMGIEFDKYDEPAEPQRRYDVDCINALQRYTTNAALEFLENPADPASILFRLLGQAQAALQRRSKAQKIEGEKPNIHELDRAVTRAVGFYQQRKGASWFGPKEVAHDEAQE